MRTNPLVGRVITSFELEPDGEQLTFETTTGRVYAHTEADCCSRTWIENIDAPERLFGHPVLSVEDLKMPDLGAQPGCEVVAYYGLKIVTALGDIVLDYRNDSTGYYGGNLNWSVA